MKNMYVRALSGLVYVGVIVGCILGGKVWFALLTLVFSWLGIIELERLLSSRVTISRTAQFIDLAMVTLVFIGCILEFLKIRGFLFLTSVVILYLPARIIVAVNDRTDNPAKSAAYSIFSLAYVFIPLILLLLAYTNSWILVLATFIFLWLNDTGAYCTGCTMGRHKLCERLSPKKTWEGFWGGFAFTIGAAVATPFILHEPQGMVWIWICYAALVSVVGTFGDLFESLIKRNLGVKDSGNLIPGHGGILDRIDSLLAVAPLTFLLALIR